VVDVVDHRKSLLLLASPLSGAVHDGGVAGLQRRREREYPGLP
jgi:hypothetical protein